MLFRSFPEPLLLALAVVAVDLAPVEDETEGVFIDVCAPLLVDTGAGELYSARVSMTPLVIRTPLEGGIADFVALGEREGRTDIARLVGGCTVCCFCDSRADGA